MTSTALCQAPRSTPATSRFERNRHKALELFATRGYGQVSLRELAAALGLTAGSLYHHCAGKQELLYEFIEEHHEALLALLSQRHAGDVPLQRLRRTLQQLVELHQQHALHFCLASRERPSLSDEQRCSIDRLRQLAQARLYGLLCAASASLPSLGNDTGLTLIALFEHLPVWLAEGPLPVEQHAALLEQMLLGAMGSRLPTP